ncbi:hypothetical protein DESUT3_38170 [Desulfuromonas versatilis]|uniref:Coiled coil domain-containing protein n=1 Tax=Desulfuromonas versatilis TaxID=2802975 RepID=A0ABM8I1G8_9BACT|nr:hypothetical protein [Desulfuromonas versatilis]BCR06748.1 hypothetical protein DESUT3_38170 [Desulfuromonas versatilis]
MEEKQAYREKFEARLRELKAQLELLEAKADLAKAEAGIEYQKQIKELRQKRDAMSARLEELKKAGGDAWRDLRTGLEKAAEDLKGALERARDKFR